MSLPKLSDFMGKGLNKVEYKRVSLIHSIKNSLARNTISQSSDNKNKLHPLQSLRNSNPNQTVNQTSSIFKYEQQLSSSFEFSNDDLHKLLGHLFMKNQHDINDTNFIKQILLKYFPEDLICAGGKNIVKCIKFETLRKNSVQILSQDPRQQQNHKQRNFYLVLRGKVVVVTEQSLIKRQSGQYFGQLQILGKRQIKQIHAKTDTMFLKINQSDFITNFGNHFRQKQAEIRRKISLMDPILNLTSYYKQLRILGLLYEKQLKTGQKIVQKGDKITEIVLMNNTDISYSQDRLLNEYKAVGLSELVSMTKPMAKETIYCMQNKNVYAISVQDFNTFIDKEILQNYLSSKYLTLSTISTNKVVSGTEKRTICSQNSCRLQTFIKTKKVKFLGHRSRILTEPNQSIYSSSPKDVKISFKYPQYTTSFVFIKQNSSPKSQILKPRFVKKFVPQTSKHKQLKQYLLKTRNSLKKKRWLDEMDINKEESIIYNPQKLEKFYETPKVIKGIQ